MLRLFEDKASAASHSAIYQPQSARNYGKLHSIQISFALIYSYHGCCDLLVYLQLQFLVHLKL